MVVVEGVARSLDPRLDMWSTAEPVVRSWIEDNLGPRGKIADAGQSLAALVARGGADPGHAYARRANGRKARDHGGGRPVLAAGRPCAAIGKANAAGHRIWRYGFAFACIIIIFLLWR